MIFECDGRRWDTAEMKQFQTGNPGQPFIFVSGDGVSVFVLTMNRWTGATVHKAAPQDIDRLADWYHLPDLRNYAAKHDAAPECADTCTCSAKPSERSEA